MSKVYLVGGSVRDTLMGHEVRDNDYVIVGATVESMLNNGYTQVGKDFPVFLHPITNEEYALARTERKSGSKHTDFEVNANSEVTLEEDLMRRDLTINAIAFDVDTKEYVDPFSGMSDISNKILRHVGAHFSEDPLRVVRLARFSSRFSDFTIDNSTRMLCSDLVKRGELNHLSSERFIVEIKKLFESRGDKKNFFINLYQFGAFKYVNFFNSIWGEIDNFTLKSVYSRVIEQIELSDRLDENDFIAITAKPDAVFPTGVSSVAVEMFKLVNQYRKVEKNAEQIYNLIKSAGFYADDTQVKYARFMRILRVMSLSGQIGKIPVEMFWEFNKFEIVSQASINLEFPELTGKALGDAIKAKRVAQIEEVLNKWKRI